MSAVRPGTIATLLADPGKCSLKRLAWAFGCSKHGSDEERQLRAALLERIKQEPTP